MKELILLTGTMGVGKSTVGLRLAALWRERGGVPAGLLTRTAGGERYLRDVATGAERLLAAEGEALAGPRWGRFSFSQEALDWGNEAVRQAVNGPTDLVLLDEVGPLELVEGAGLLPALHLLLRSAQAGLVVVRPALLDPLRALVGGRPVRVYEVTLENRDGLAEQISNEMAG